MPEVDEYETWQLLKASENETHTYLMVGRVFNTCDSQDVAIGVSRISQYLHANSQFWFLINFLEQHK